uniref:Putative secreted protein n=1 Tax=Anopheles marajoara TaxID=58244 RepID=A0A2M4CDB9_9DIPT
MLFASFFFLLASSFLAVLKSFVACCLSPSPLLSSMPTVVNIIMRRYTPVFSPRPSTEHTYASHTSYTQQTETAEPLG